MFRASSRPSSGAQLQWQSLVLPLELGGSSSGSNNKNCNNGTGNIANITVQASSLSLSKERAEMSCPENFHLCLSQ